MHTVVRSVLGAIAVGGGIIAALTMADRNEGSDGEKGIVTVAAGRGAADEHDAGAAPPGLAPPIASVRTSRAGPDVPEDASSYDVVRSQVRDSVWASSTEGGIVSALRDVPYLGADRPLTAACGATVCVLSGGIDGNASPHNRNTSLRYLRDAGFAERLNQVNALTDQVVVDPATGAFVITFSRVRR